MTDRSRRALLRSGVTAGVLALAGCAGLSGDGRERRRTFGVPSRTPETGPETEPETTDAPNDVEWERGPPRTSYPPIRGGEAGPPPSCPPGRSPLDPPWVVLNAGPLGGFDLVVEPSTVAVGDRLTARIRNVAGDERRTRSRRAVDVQRRSGGRWRTVYGTADAPDHGGAGVLHQPDSGFAWSFRATAEGISALDGDGDGGYVACGPVAAGTYRFVYWGITTERGADEGFETNYALGAAFEVRAE